MKLNFKNNYIKRISFYGGLIAFFVALGLSVFSWFSSTLQEGETLINNAKSSLAPYIKWYQEDSSQELERYKNLSKAEFEKLDVSLIIIKNLQDMKVIIENIDILTRFEPFYDEYGLKDISIKGIKSINHKLHILLQLLWKEKEYQPKNPYFILNNPKLYQSLLDFQSFIESQIKENVLNKNKREKASFDRLAIYIYLIVNIFDAFNSLILSDIKNNTCKIDKSIIQNALTQYDFSQKNAKLLSDTLNQKIKEYSVDDERRENAIKIKKAFNLYSESIIKEQSTITIIQSNLKECK